MRVQRAISLPLAAAVAAAVALTLTLLVVAVAVPAQAQQDGMCEMMGRDGAMDPPTVYHGPPFKADPPIVDCQWDLDDKGFGCCSHEQSQTFHDSFKTAVFTFFRCPACIDNIRTLWCAFTCSYKQSTFLDSHNGTKHTPEGYPIVSKVNFHVTDRFSEALYNSCKDNPFAGAVPLGQFVTSPAGFLLMLQSTKSYISITTAPNGLDVPLKNCSDSCSCNFCRSACHRSNNYGSDSDDAKYHVGALDLTLLQLIMGIVFVAVSVVVIIAAVVVSIIRNHRKKKYEVLR